MSKEIRGSIRSNSSSGACRTYLSLTSITHHYYINKYGSRVVIGIAGLHETRRKEDANVHGCVSHCKRSFVFVQRTIAW